jgi:hypothetical protein
MDLRPPFRQQFDNARDPYTARNALGITSSGGGGGAPTDAQYIVAVDDPTLTNDRVLINTVTVTWDLTTPGQVKANAVAGGNVSNSGTPALGQYAKWVTATTIQGVAPATVLSDIGAQPAGSYLTTAAAAAAYQPLDADLTAIAALTGTNVIYYRSAANTWAAVTIGANLTFSGGTLAATVPPSAPVSAEYITSTADATLTAERVLTDTATITWDRTTAGQIKANAAASGGGGLLAIRVITASGTYTPTLGMVNCIIECVGGGGGGGGSLGFAAQAYFGGGGGAGGYSRALKTAAQIGASQPVTIGAGGIRGIGNTPSVGGNGGATSVGALCVANGGQGGGIPNITSGGAGGVVTGAVGDLVAGGAPGSGSGYFSGTQTSALPSIGGSSFFGGGGVSGQTINLAIVGANATNYGSGGGGGSVVNVAGGADGGLGSAGVVVITEYK